MAGILRSFFPLETITSEQGKKIWTFEWSDQLEEIKRAYDRGILTVNASQLIAAQESIKRTIYDDKY